MKSTILVLTLAIGICACESTQEHEIYRYCPEEYLLNRGVINKYYETFHPANPDLKSRADISYHLLQKLDSDRLRVDIYNPGFQLTNSLEYRVDQKRLYVNKNIRIFRLDTIAASIKNGLSQDWSDSTFNPPYLAHFEYDSTSRYSYKAEQHWVKDTVLMEKPAKMIATTWEVTDLDQEEVVQTFTRIETYVAGFGLFKSTSEVNSGRWEVELIEQLPLNKFNELANHNRHRVAYIDPEYTLDDAAGFELCGHELNIADYYNSTPKGEYVGGKREMMDIIEAKLDTSKLLNESGYLTIRFVVNCKGQAGRFTTELADLNFQEKQFPQETIDHLFGILYELKDWRPVVIKEEPRDAYLYITFKLKDGAITDILP